MSPAPRSIPLSLAILLSLIIHASAAFVIAREPMRHLPPAAEHLAAPEDEPPAPWRLGIDHAAPKTAIAWIGYDTFRAMNAPKSQTEQAAQTKQAPTQAIVEVLESVSPPPSPPAPDPAQARRAVQQVTQRVEQAAQAMDETTAKVLELARALTGTLALPIGGTPPNQKSDAANPQPPAAQPVAPPAPPTTTAAAPEPGELADRESPPATTLPAIEADDLGHPIAAQGIVIETVRPRFSHYIRLTADPKDPLVRIHFDRGGRVRWVELAESSGYQAVDEPIKAAVYRWRATGEALQTLQAEKPDQVLIITLRILL
ncbi:MAG: energy transducer TonB [Phycisphaerales bacterium]|nr:energy transducer TonB [Phycisphaerales bacterium]